MKTFSHLRQYLAKFFLEWEIFWTKVAEKIKTRILCPVTFFLKSCLLWDNFEKCGGAREARMSSQYAVYELLAKQGYMHARTRMHTPTRLDTHARTLNAHTRTHTHTRARSHVILLAFLRQQWFAHVPQCYVIRTLPVFLFLIVRINEPHFLRGCQHIFNWANLAISRDTCVSHDKIPTCQENLKYCLYPKGATIAPSVQRPVTDWTVPGSNPSRSQWPSGLRRKCVADRSLGLRVRMPQGAWMFVLCVVSTDKRQNAAQSRQRNKYGWSTGYKRIQKKTG